MLRYFISRPFLVSFFATLLAVTLIFGILYVDARGRKLSFNDTTPPFEMIYSADGTAELQINAFSLDRRVDVTGVVRVWHFIADFFCIPHARFPKAEPGQPAHQPVGLQISEKRLFSARGRFPRIAKKFVIS
ncbi:MAG: hypothetical protein J6C51_04830 [Clostridia bacterium]|nr:hypothetical protein [Clostridia bacterium]